MNELVSRLGHRISPYLHSFLVALGWGTAFAGVTLWAIFQGLLLPKFKAGPLPAFQVTEPMWLVIYYSAVFGISVLSGLIIADVGRTIGGFIISLFLGAWIIFETLSAPGQTATTLDNLMIITRELLTRAAIDLTFRALFPITIFVLLLGAIAGAALGEHYF